MIKDTHSESDSESENDCRPMRNRTFRVEYHGLHFDLSSSNHWSEANRSRILLAALYLKDRFQLLICHLRALHRANLTVSSRNLQVLVADLKQERMLKDATVEACLTLYFQLVNAKRCLDAHIAELTTSAPFTPTHLYKIAEYLVDYDDEIQKAKAANMAAMDGSSSRKKISKILDAMAKEGSENGQSLYTDLTGASPRANSRSSASSPTESLPSTPTSLQPASSSASSPGEAELSGKSHEKMEQEMQKMHTQMTDLLITVKTQQSIIEALQGRVNTLESDLSKSKEDQEQRLRLALRGMDKLEE
ncbi:hypothetical protein BGZ81_005632 [Podila clonocystis]|nr:hypothetical protein BGZ81_005632 [Podila clonocystis]